MSDEASGSSDQSKHTWTTWPWKAKYSPPDENKDASPRTALARELMRRALDLREDKQIVARAECMDHKKGYATFLSMYRDHYLEQQNNQKKAEGDAFAPEKSSKNLYFRHMGFKKKKKKISGAAQYARSVRRALFKTEAGSDTTRVQTELQDWIDSHVTTSPSWENTHFVVLYQCQSAGCADYRAKKGTADRLYGNQIRGVLVFHLQKVPKSSHHYVALRYVDVNQDDSQDDDDATNNDVYDQLSVWLLYVLYRLKIKCRGVYRRSDDANVGTMSDFIDHAWGDTDKSVVDLGEQHHGFEASDEIDLDKRIQQFTQYLQLGPDWEPQQEKLALQRQQLQVATQKKSKLDATIQTYTEQIAKETTALQDSIADATPTHYCTGQVTSAKGTCTPIPNSNTCDTGCGDPKKVSDLLEEAISAKETFADMLAKDYADMDQEADEVTSVVDVDDPPDDEEEDSGRRINEISPALESIRTDISRLRQVARQSLDNSSVSFYSPTDKSAKTTVEYGTDMHMVLSPIGALKSWKQGTQDLYQTLCLQQGDQQQGSKWTVHNRRITIVDNINVLWSTLGIDSYSKGLGLQLVNNTSNKTHAWGVLLFDDDPNDQSAEHATVTFEILCGKGWGRALYAFMMEATKKWWNTEKSNHNEASLQLLMEVTTTVKSDKDKEDQCKKLEKEQCISTPGCNYKNYKKKSKKKNTQLCTGFAPPQTLVDTYKAWLTNEEGWTFHDQEGSAYEGNFTNQLQ